MLNSWWLPTIISAIGLGIYDVCKKHAVKDNSVMPALFFATACGTAFFLLFSAITGDISAVLNCNTPHFLLILLKSVIVSSSWICVYYAMREMPISLASPIRSTSPLWTMIGGITIFREIPTLWQGVGMAAILAGYMIFTMLGEKEGLPWKSKGMQLIILNYLKKKAE